MSKVLNSQTFNKLNAPFKGAPNQCRKLSAEEKKMLNEYMRKALLQSYKDSNKFEFFQKYLLPIYKKVADVSVKIEKIFHKVLK